MNKIFLLIFLLFINQIFSQDKNEEININKLTSDYIKTLQSKKIDTICVYENYSIGCELTYDLSKIYDEETCKDELKNQPTYIFWKENGKTFLTKINTCFEYPDTISTSDNFWKIYYSYKNIIQKEIVKSFEFRIPSDKKNKISTLKTSHSTYQIFRMIDQKNTTIKVFDNYDLKSKTYFNEIVYNINYEHNISLKSKLIIDILERITSEAEKNNTFKKIKSR